MLTIAAATHSQTQLGSVLMTVSEQTCTVHSYGENLQCLQVKHVWQKLSIESEKTWLSHYVHSFGATLHCGMFSDQPCTVQCFGADLQCLKAKNIGGRNRQKSEKNQYPNWKSEESMSV
jgi:hypothetical protein